MNKELLQLFRDSKSDKSGYQKRLKELWDIRYPDHKKFTPKHLAEQVRNIKKKKLLPTTEISRINDGTGEDERETSTQEARNIMKRYKPNKQIVKLKIRKISKRELET